MKKVLIIWGVCLFITGCQQDAGLPDDTAVLARVGEVAITEQMVAALLLNQSVAQPSAEQKAAFDKAPAKYLPQYGGFCAFGIYAGAKFRVDPNKFIQKDGKYYLSEKQIKAILDQPLDPTVARQFRRSAFSAHAQGDGADRRGAGARAPDPSGGGCAFRSDR